MKKDFAEGPPPFLGSWRRIYILVILYLVTLITIFWLFGKAWS